MTIKKDIGRPQKMDYRTMLKIADAIQHNSSISDATRFAGVSRQTYYFYLNNPVFSEVMATAKTNQNKLVMSFLTVW